MGCALACHAGEGLDAIVMLSWLIMLATAASEEPWTPHGASAIKYDGKTGQIDPLKRLQLCVHARPRLHSPGCVCCRACLRSVNAEQKEVAWLTQRGSGGLETEGEFKGSQVQRFHSQVKGFRGNDAPEGCQFWSDAERRSMNIAS